MNYWLIGGAAAAIAFVACAALAKARDLESRLNAITGIRDGGVYGPQNVPHRTVGADMVRVKVPSPFGERERTVDEVVTAICDHLKLYMVRTPPAESRLEAALRSDYDIGARMPPPTPTKPRKKGGPR